MSVAGLAALGAGVTALSGLADTGVNWYLTEKTNKQNEALMRESWAREDNAVQRRVADLKAAGLSPTLAAGSAAASSGPVSMKAPQVNTSAAFQNAVATASAVKALKNQDLQNEYLKKQIDNYGLPDWAIYMQNLFGDKWTDIIRGFGDKVYNWIFGNGSAPGSVPWNSGSSAMTSFPSPSARPNLKTDLSIGKPVAPRDPGLPTSKPSTSGATPVSPTSEPFNLQNQYLRSAHDALYDELGNYAVGQAKGLDLTGIYNRYVKDLIKEDFDKEHSMRIVSSWIKSIMDDLGYTYDSKDKLWYYDH